MDFQKSIFEVVNSCSYYLDLELHFIEYDFGHNKLVFKFLFLNYRHANI